MTTREARRHPKGKQPQAAQSIPPSRDPQDRRPEDAPIDRVARQFVQFRRGAGVVERARLESECTVTPYRGFESLPLRQKRKSPALRGFFVSTGEGCISNPEGRNSRVLYQTSPIRGKLGGLLGNGFEPRPKAELADAQRQLSRPVPAQKPRACGALLYLPERETRMRTPVRTEPKAELADAQHQPSLPLAIHGIAGRRPLFFQGCSASPT